MLMEQVENVAFWKMGYTSFGAFDITGVVGTDSFCVTGHVSSFKLLHYEKQRTALLIGHHDCNRWRIFDSQVLRRLV